MYIKMLRLVETLKEMKSRDRETGVSLVEILVYILLFSIIAVMTVTIITSTVDSSNRFAETSTTQTQVNQSASVLQRDISLANAITFASSTRIDFRVRQDNTDFEIKVFEYIPGTTTEFPQGTVIGDLPPYNAIIQVRTNVNTGETGQSVLVQGIQPSETARQLFRYFDASNGEIMDTSSADSLNTIARVEFNIVANSTGRASNIELRSSATPSYTLPPGVQNDNLLASVPDCPPNFSATIVARETQASINWNAPSGATSYTVYRYNQSTGNALERTEVIPNPDTTSWLDTGLAWGTTYRYAIQASGPGGTTAQCASSVATVVPDQIEFANLNSLQQSLTATKSGAGAETLTAPAVTGIVSATASTQNITPGTRYTVARNLINQLAWQTTDGVTRYNVYIQGDSTPIAQISSGTAYWQHSGRNFGDVTTYVIRAENAGGESFASDPITLISPPAASTFSVTTPDTSTRATTTDAVFTVTSRAANTVGFKAERHSVLTANANCNAVAAYSPANFSGNSVTDDDSPWGSANCYVFTPFNNAGDGQPSSGIEVDQLPGKFTTRPLSSTQYQWINESVPLPAEAQCWLDPNGLTAAPCFGGLPGQHSSSNRLPIGLFERIRNTKTNITVNWNESENAFGGYRVERVRQATGGTVDQAGSAQGNAAYVNGVQSLRFNNEMPGSMYQFRVVAIAANGLERDNVTVRHLTSPDIPSYAHNKYQHRSAYTWPTTYRRIDLTFNRSVIRGMVTGFIARTATPYGNTEQAYGTGGQVMHNSVSGANGHNSRSVTSTLSYDGFYAVGATIGRAGFTNPGCNPCGSAWGDLPEYYPRYWAGTFARYHGGGSAAVGSVVQGNPSALPAPTGPVDPPATGADEGTLFNCATTSEADPDFVAEGCEPGTGIPVTPTNLRVTAQDSSNVTIAWNAVSNVQGYILRVTDEGGTTANYTQAGTSRTIAAPGPGEDFTITVLSYNLVNDSPVSSSITVTTGLAAPANLRLVTGNNSSATFAWDAVSGAQSYTVRITQLGVTNTYNTASLSRTVSLGEGISTQISVRANRGSNSSAYSGTLTHDVAAVTPTGLTLVDETLILLLSWNEEVQWDDTPSAYNGYRLTAVVDGNVRTYNIAAGTTSFTVTNIPLGADVDYSIVALAPGGNSPASPVVSKSY